MAGDWSTHRLGDLVEIKHGFAFQGEFFREEPPGDILLTPGNFAISGGFKTEKLKYYTGPVPQEFILQEDDLLVTMTDLSKAADTLGYPAIVPRSHRGRRFLHNQRRGKVLVKVPSVFPGISKRGYCERNRNDGQAHFTSPHRSLSFRAPNSLRATRHRPHPRHLRRKDRAEQADERDAGGDRESAVQIVVH